jgi:flagellar hook-associated protein 3 FlgL
MRISTSYIQQQSVDTMLRQQKQLADTQLQVSTGQRVLSPSDDPIAAVKILGLEREKNINEQYLLNADVAEAKISKAETTLSSATDLIQRIRELAIQGLNDSNDASARAGIAEEVRELNKSLVSLANTTDANGEYLFSGYQSFTQAFDPTTFAYNGDSGERHLRVGSDYTVEVNEPGDAIFVQTNADASVQSIFQTIDDFATALSTNTVGTGPNDGEFLDNMNTSIDSLTSARARMGSKMNAIDQQRSINNDGLTSLDTSLTKLKDLDYAEAISRLNAQTTGLQAAQQAYVKVQGLSLFNFL